MLPKAGEDARVATGVHPNERGVYLCRGRMSYLLALRV